MGFTQSPAPPLGGPSLYPGGSLPLPPGGLLFDMGDVLYDATMWRPWLLRVPVVAGVLTEPRLRAGSGDPRRTEGHPWPQAHRG